MQKRKLIEVALPLETINRESAREKSIRHGHPSTLHLWWARRPLAAARAVLFAQLVDDPSSRPDVPDRGEATPRARTAARSHRAARGVGERPRRKAVRRTHAEILKSTDGDPPAILDPFAGGGTIPLEAQRLGLEAHACDLNPVAVLINKALIEIPPKFAGQPPVFPGLADAEMGTGRRRRASGRCSCLRRVDAGRGAERIGHLYPKATRRWDGRAATAIAWIWARSVTCPNPACGIEMPLVRSWWLGKKKGKEAYIVPRVVADTTHPSGQRVIFDIGHDPANAPTPATDGTVTRTGAVCVACGAGIDLATVRKLGGQGKIGQQLMAIAAEGNRARAYLAADDVHVLAAKVERPLDYPDGDLSEQALGFRVQAYGMTRWADLFSNRQLVGLTALSDLVSEARNVSLGIADPEPTPTRSRRIWASLSAA